MATALLAMWSNWVQEVVESVQKEDAAGLCALMPIGFDCRLGSWMSDGVGGGRRFVCGGDGRARMSALGDWMGL